MQTTSSQTVRQLMRDGNRFTDQDFMSALGIGHSALKEIEADPGQLSLIQVVRLAELLNVPVLELVQLVFTEASQGQSAQ